MEKNKSQNYPHDFRKIFPLKDGDTCGIPNRDKVIDKYINGQLTTTETDAFDEHVFYCETCFKELSFREKIVAVLAKEAERKEEAPTTKSIFNRSAAANYWKYWPIAASVAFLIFIFLGRDQIRQLGREQFHQIGREEIHQENSREQKNIFTENSQESRIFEGLVNSHRRSASVKITSPPNDFNARDKVLFQWEGSLYRVLHLVICNNKEYELLNLTLNENQFLLDVKDNKLPPGLYYWKLKENHDLLHVGKFFVNKPEQP